MNLEMDRENSYKQERRKRREAPEIKWKKSLNWLTVQMGGV
jgi:hypothetical protein